PNRSIAVVSSETAVGRARTSIRTVIDDDTLGTADALAITAPRRGRGPRPGRAVPRPPGDPPRTAEQGAATTGPWLRRATPQRGRPAPADRAPSPRIRTSLATQGRRRSSTPSRRGSGARAARAVPRGCLVRVRRRRPRRRARRRHGRRRAASRRRRALRTPREPTGSRPYPSVAR